MTVKEKDQWKYFCNDTEVDKETYDKIVEEHRQWLIEEEKKREVVEKQERKKRRA